MPACQFASAAPEEAVVYGACEPGWDRGAAPTVSAWIDFVRARGIERVCCLLSDRQVAAHDSLIERYRDAFGPERVAHVPVTDHTLLDVETLGEEILPFLSAAADADEPVVVHCRAGIGRTGQALAGWLVRARGYDPEDAIATVKARHRQPDEAVRAGNGRPDELVALLEAVR